MAEAPLSSGECRQMLSDHLSAIRAVLKGQSYTIGGRSMTRADLSKLQEGVTFWNGMLNEALELEKRNGRRCVVVRAVIPHG